MPNSGTMISFRGLFKNKSSKASKKGGMPSFSDSTDGMGFEDDFDFSTSSKFSKRDSICLNGLNAISIAGSSDSVSGKKVSKKKTLLRSSSSSISTKSSGGPDHRPLVGGFAAAAYEAARADFYKQQGIEANGHESNKSKLRSYLMSNGNTSFQ